MTRMKILEGIVEGHARRDAKLFVEEFREPIDPSATDWDATAWGDVRRALGANEPTEEELDHLWTHYQRWLVSETERLASKEA